MTQQDAVQIIRSNYKRLTKQQFKTLMGQVKAGDLEGAIKGLRRLLNDTPR